MEEPSEEGEGFEKRIGCSQGLGGRGVASRDADEALSGPDGVDSGTPYLRRYVLRETCVVGDHDEGGWYTIPALHGA